MESFLVIIIDLGFDIVGAILLIDVIRNIHENKIHKNMDDYFKKLKQEFEQEYKNTYGEVYNWPNLFSTMISGIIEILAKQSRLKITSMRNVWMGIGFLSFGFTLQIIGNIIQWFNFM